MEDKFNRITYACKYISKHLLNEYEDLASLNHEIEYIRKFDHPNIVKLHTFFDNETFVFLVLDYFSNSCMKNLLRNRKRLSEFEAKYYTKQVALALKEIHSKNIIHRDINLENLLIDDKMRLKLNDFEFAIEVKSKKERRRSF